MSKAGHVYVLEAVEGAYKIGHSRNPAKRQKALGAHLTLVHQTEEHGQAERLEKAAHRILEAAGKTRKGEMFLVSLQEALDAIREAEILLIGGWSPPEFTRTFTLRADKDFIAAVSELQIGTAFTKSDVIRRAVMEMRDRRRKTRK